ncbi:MAG: class I SAM-dependent methyltransferase [Thiotrichales bacterium]|nr:class I SAM-dependent methyltransferase [Thiotrichales bacterium]
MLFSKADGILDLRSFEDFKAAHLVDATWMAWPDLPEHLNELPASPAEFFLVGSAQAIEEASIFLDSKAYKVSGSLVIETPETMQVWGDKLPGLLVSGAKSKALWSPNSLLVEFTEQVALDVKSIRPSALDLGCGGGRDAVFLAKQGWQVSAIDNENRVIKRAKQLALRSGASVKFRCCDLKNTGCLTDQTFDLVMVMRFLNRDLFEPIKQRIKPGGWLVFQTFTEGVEKFGSPKNPNFILKRDELSQVFKDFKIITDRMETLSDGRPVVSFIAQKLDGNNE